MKMVGKAAQVAVVILFCLLIGLPIVQMKCNIWQGSLLDEKRPKAAFPSIDLVSLQNGTFTRQFETYFNDHMGFRDRLIKLHSKVDMYVFKITSNSKVILGQDDYLFFADTLDDYNKQATLSPEAVAEIADKLMYYQQRLAARGIVFLFIVGPNKNTIYPEFMPAAPQHEGQMSNYEQLRLELNNRGVNYIDPVPELWQNKRQYPLYYKRDTHWNAFSAAIVDKMLLERFNHQLSLHVGLPEITGISELPPETIEGHDLNDMLGLDSALKTSRIYPSIVYQEGRNVLPPMLWYGDSFSTELRAVIQPYAPDLEFLPYGKQRFKDTLAQYLPGKKIVLLEIVERSLPYLLEQL